MPYLRTILTDNHPTLRKVAKRVERSEIADPLFQQLIDDMFETMYAAPGIGLAAPQVGVSKRLFVIDLQDGKDDEHDEHDEDGGEREERHGPYALINPRFTVTEGEIISLEGCLSVPGLIGDVRRYERVVCTALDRHGKRIEFDGTGLFGRCLQHEMDHLDGILYTDKATNVRPAATEEEQEALEAVEIEAQAVERIARKTGAALAVEPAAVR